MKNIKVLVFLVLCFFVVDSFANTCANLFDSYEAHPNLSLVLFENAPQETRLRYTDTATGETVDQPLNFRPSYIVILENTLRVAVSGLPYAITVWEYEPSLKTFVLQGTTVFKYGLDYKAISTSPKGNLVIAVIKDEDGKTIHIDSTPEHGGVNTGTVLRWTIKKKPFDSLKRVGVDNDGVITAEFIDGTVLKHQIDMSKMKLIPFLEELKNLEKQKADKSTK